MSNKRQEEQALEEALSPIVNRLIDRNYETSQDKIAMQMAPLIGAAIREQIKSQKDDVVDALYPVLGNMISRYVTKMLEDMLNKINAQIQDGLSSKSIKRKIRAKLQGVSESELLLNENATTNIQSLLLIHKETGIVLAHAENPASPVSEPEMLASMMTAIRSFVNDWIEQNESNQELGEIEYGGNKIIIEASGYSYLAVIVNGSTQRNTYDKIRQTLENIVLKYGDTIRKFDGDLTAFANIEIYKELLTLLDSNTNEEEIEEEKSIHPLLFILPVVFLLWGGYSYYKSSKDETVKKSILEKFYKTPQLTSYKLSVSNKDGLVKLQGTVPFKYYKELAQKLAQGIDGVTKVNNELVVIDALQDPIQISSNIAYLLRGLNTQKGINLTYSYDYMHLKVEGWVYNRTLLQKVKDEIQKVPNISNIEYKIVIKPPHFETKIYFNRASAKLTPPDYAKLIKSIGVIKNLDEEYKLLVTAYSDQIGSPTKNTLLAKRRIKNTIKFLQDATHQKNRFITVIKDTPPRGIDVKSQADKARCIILKYTKGESNASL